MKRPANFPNSLWLVLLLLDCTANAEESITHPPSDRALLIGINQYRSKDVPQLTGTANDVSAFHAMLTSQLGFKDSEIKELKDAQATKEGILNALDQWLAQGSKPGSRIVLYYSGHGHWTQDRSGDEADGMDEVLIPHDAMKTGQNWLLDDEISERLQRLKDRQVLAVFDSCHSGTVTRAAFQDDSWAKTPNWDAEMVAARGGVFDASRQKEGGFIEGGGNVAAFFAVAPNQKAREDRRGSRAGGVFTTAFVNGVAGAADSNRDGQVSYAELFDFLQAQSDAYCQALKEKCGEGLTPTREFDDIQLSADIRRFGQANASTEPQPDVSETASDILAHGNEANLHISLGSGGNSLRLGDLVRYKVHTGRAGKLVIFDVGPDGNVTQLFPNNFVPSNKSGPCKARPAVEWVEAGTNVLIPDNCMGFNIEAQEPVGKGSLYALLIEDASIDTQDLIVSSRGLGRVKGNPAPPIFEDVNKPKQWMGKLRARLDQPYHEKDGSNRAVRWSVTRLDYAITR